MRNLTPVDSLDIIQCCRRICNPEVVYNVNQLAMAHEAMAAMKDEAAGIRNVIDRAEEIKEDSKSSLNKTMFQLLSDLNRYFLVYDSITPEAIADFQTKFDGIKAQ